MRFARSPRPQRAFVARVRSYGHVESILKAGLDRVPLHEIPDAQHALRRRYRAIYRRASGLFDELALARADGTYARLLARLARVDQLVRELPQALARPSQRRPWVAASTGLDQCEKRSIVNARIGPS